MATSVLNPDLIASLSESDLELCNILIEYGQKNNLASFTTKEQLANFLEDTKSLAITYPGGIQAYITSAKDLISKSTKNVNPFEGFDAKIPFGENLEYMKGSYEEIEKLGKEQLKHCGFALVGGGIGERLNSNYIKLSLTSDLVRDKCFLGDYCDYLHSIEEEFDCEVPLAIMTSDGTHNDTQKLLEANQYFGLKSENVTLMKQNGVPAICSVEGEIAVKEDGHFVKKPHGHGDIHLLMSQFHLPEKWMAMGIKYVIFFQDTNGLSMHGYCPLLGVAEKNQFDFCSMAILRRPGEKVGGICRLEKPTGESLTCNVEYNQLESVLLACTGQGDVANEHGNSNYPGNINLLCIRLDNYQKVLQASGGVVQEFVNPKFKDATRTSFLAPTRLECMMQDYPKLLTTMNAKVGFVTLARWQCFSAVKNSDENAVKQFNATGFPESFFSGEEDIYKFYRRVLRQKGLQVGSEEYDETNTQPLGMPRFPLITLSSRKSLTTQDIASHFGNNVTISDKSSLLIDGDVVLENVVLDGALVVRACKGAKVIIRDCTIQNKGWFCQEVDKNDPNVENKFALRGYELIKEETRELVFDKPGIFEITE